jgi:hypothetical protein
MNKQERRYAAYIGLMIGLAIGLLLTSGCMTKYSISKQMQDGSSVVVTVQSFREFEQPQIHYSRDGENVTFDFGAAAATTGESPIEAAVADVIRATPSVILPVPE